jgi:uncharacterized membrane protein
MLKNIFKVIYCIIAAFLTLFILVLMMYLTVSRVTPLKGTMSMTAYIAIVCGSIIAVVVILILILAILACLYTLLFNWR